MKKFRFLLAVLTAVALMGGTALAASTIGTNMSTTGTLTVTSDSATSVQFQDAAGTTTVFIVDTTNTRAGVNAGGAVDTTFEVGGTASITSVFALTNFVAGKDTASSSTAYLGEFSSTGTTSLLLHGTSTNKGTCLQMKNTAGTIVYLRIETTTLTINTVGCHP